MELGGSCQRMLDGEILMLEFWMIRSYGEMVTVPSKTPRKMLHLNETILQTDGSITESQVT